MSYAIITVGGKQYRVREGERLLVDRVALDDGGTFTPTVLLSGGDGGVAIAPADVTVTARVVEQQRGPKIRIGKYKKRTGYKRHAGFRAALTQIEIESIGGAKRAQAKRAETAPAEEAPAATETVVVTAGLPDGYEGLTIAALKDAAVSWSAEELAAALEHERAHANRKGAVAALEAALAAKEA
jgi:large subunit ribosomal protein L21